MTEKVIEKRCFIITPIGGERSDIRDALDGLLKNVLEPVLIELGFNDGNITVAHQMKDSGSINTQLITRIIEDELCIVNLTGLNPNVMYELAIRHAVGKPVVIIAEHGTKLPFDIIDQRTIFYSNTMLGAVNLKEALIDMVGSIFSNPNQISDNPIIKIITDNAILDKIKSDGREHSELALVLNKLSNLEEKIINNVNSKYVLEGVSKGKTMYTLGYTGELDSAKLNKELLMFNIVVYEQRMNPENRVYIQFLRPLKDNEFRIFMEIIEKYGVFIDE